jgi:hypothetical protein
MPTPSCEKRGVGGQGASSASLFLQGRFRPPYGKRQVKGVVNHMLGRYSKQLSPQPTPSNPSGPGN